MKIDNELMSMNEQLGKSLLEQALTDRRKSAGALASGQIQGLLNRIDTTNRAISIHNENLELYQKQLDAIESGSFKVQQYFGDVLVSFHDDNLNDAVTKIMSNGKTLDSVFGR